MGRLTIFPSYFTHIHYGNTSPYDKYIIASHIEQQKKEKDNGQSNRYGKGHSDIKDSSK